MLPSRKAPRGHNIPQLSKAGRVMTNWIQSLYREAMELCFSSKGNVVRLVFSCVYYHTETSVYTHLCIQITQ